MPSVLGTAAWRDSWFIINRILDVIFTLDICLQFFVAYQTGTSYGGYTWIENQKKIVRHYLTTWFLLDAGTVVLPGAFDVYLAGEAFNAVMEPAASPATSATSATPGMASGGGSGGSGGSGGGGGGGGGGGADLAERMSMLRVPSRAEAGQACAARPRLSPLPEMARKAHALLRGQDPPQLLPHASVLDALLRMHHRADRLAASGR